MIKQIHHHSVDMDILTRNGWVLDLGCNDFLFARTMISLGMKVIGVEPIKNLVIPQDLLNNENFILVNKACVGIKNVDKKTYFEYHSWSANSLVNTPDNLHNKAEHGGHADNTFKTSYEVDLVTISELMETHNVDQFEYIKIDIEGGEYEIVENLPKNCVKQFSVEYHDFLSLNPLGDDVETYHKNLIETDLSDFTVEYQDVEPLKGKVWSDNRLQRNDVLYVLKNM